MPQNHLGSKYQRLNSLRKSHIFRDIVPPLFPISSSVLQPFVSQLGSEVGQQELCAKASEYLQRHHENLLIQAQSVCGQFPWIIRSSGEFEDTENNPQAGRYKSIPCHDHSKFYSNLAEVMLSGFDNRSRLQGAVFSDEPLNKSGMVISAFIQPLKTSLVGGELKFEGVPYLQNEGIQTLKNILRNLHKLMGNRLDCEFVLETDKGPVSVTTLTSTEQNREGINGQASFGFGLFSAQDVSVGSNNSSVYWLEDTDVELWAGETLVSVALENCWLVQVRPAPQYSLMGELLKLSDSSKQHLRRGGWIQHRAQEVLIPAKHVRVGRFIRAATLNAAWNQYISMSSDARGQLAGVVVTHGTRTEHAGIMFGQVGLSVVQLDVNSLPENYSICVIDAVCLDCYFHSDVSKVKTELETEMIESLNIPQSCSVIFTLNDPGSIDIENVVTLGFGLEALAQASVKLIPILKISGFSSDQRTSILQRSIFPTPSSVFIQGDRCYSPTMLGVLAVKGEWDNPYSTTETLKDGTEPSFHSELFRKCALASEGQCVRDLLPTLSNVGKETIQEFVSHSNLLINWELVKIESRTSAITNTTLEKLLCVAQEKYRQSRDPWLTVHVLKAFNQFVSALDTLSVYTVNDKNRYLLELTSCLGSATALDVKTILSICSDNMLPVHYIPVFCRAVLNDRAFAISYADFRDALQKFKLYSLSEWVGSPQSIINNEYMAFRKRVLSKDQLHGLDSVLFSEVVESYDVKAKQLLQQLAWDFDTSAAELYVKILRSWVQIIPLSNAFGQRARDKLLDWLSQQNVQTLSGELCLPDMHWKVILERAQEGKESLGLTNMHHLHNVLHQWSLSMTPPVAMELPKCVAELVGFAQTFSEQTNKLLRFRREMFELELPMCTHKASFIFKSNLVEIEFSEPPETDDEDLARLFAFDTLLGKFNEWFDEYTFTCSVYKAVGTWTLYIRVSKSQNELLQSQDYIRVFGLLRLLFDSSYDFSHESIDSVKHIGETFSDAAWGELWGMLLEYRLQFSDLSQFMDLKSFTLSSLVTNLCLSDELSREFVHAYQKGLNYCVTKLNHYANLCLCQGRNYDRWLVSYKMLNHLALLIAVVWPESGLELLRDSSRLSAVVKDLLARNLLPRQDIQKRISSDCGITRDDVLYESIIHHASFLILHENNANRTSEDLLLYPKRFKRAKQYLLHRFPECITPTNLRGLIEDLDTVPFGYGSVQEDVLRHVVGNRRRYDIHNTILYVD